MKNITSSSFSTGSPSAQPAFGHSPFSALVLTGGALTLNTPTADSLPAVTAKPAAPALKARVVRRPMPIVKKQPPRFIGRQKPAAVAAHVTAPDKMSTAPAPVTVPPVATAAPARSTTVTATISTPATNSVAPAVKAVDPIWQVMQKALETRENVRGIVKQVVEGNGRIYGLRIQLPGTDVLAFAPFTRLGVPITEVHPLLHSEQCFKVIEVDLAKGTIVLNRRQANAQELLDGLIDRVKIGQVLQGKVRNIADCGAFIEINGACGLIHVSKLPADDNALRKGQAVSVRVIKLNKARHHLGLELA